MRKPYSAGESKAFIELFDLEPSGPGILNGCSFAVKDLIDVNGRRTGCGNPTWLQTHPPATAHAVCVEQLLSAGARCAGKTITDELAFSLLGENYFYGTPLNPAAPDRVPGGSSSGSASAVACGIVDFALGTDTGGSVRVPAANCGIWGIRTTHGRVSVAGVNPLSPSLDTVGVLASTLSVLMKASSVLLSFAVPAPADPQEILLVREAFDLCDPEIRKAMEVCVRTLNQNFPVHEISIREIDGDSGASGLRNWFEIYRIVQRAEAENCFGAWVASVRPSFGPLIAESFELTRSLDRRLIADTMEKRESLFRRMKSFLAPKSLLCIPTIPAPAPLKGSILKREQSPEGYYPRTLCLTSIAGVARMPQVTMPVAEASGAPAGLSLIGATSEDSFLLSATERVASVLSLQADMFQKTITGSGNAT